MSENKIDYYKSANWAFLQGNFTPDDLRKIADKIEKDHKRFQKKQSK